MNKLPYSTLSSPPVKLEESWSLKKFSTKILCKILCLLTYCELDFLIFVFLLFKYDEIIIKQPSSCTFGIKVVKF